jgi:hypothetical protein
VDSLRFVICARVDCQQVFFLCRLCDRGDRYCSRRCADRARRATLHAAGRRYQRSWPGRVHHAARQARYRARRQNVTHQTSPPVLRSGIILVPPPMAPGGEQEADHDAEAIDPHPRGGPRCARCGRRGRFLRHVTLAHLRPPRPPPRR